MVLALFCLTPSGIILHQVSYNLLLLRGERHSLQDIVHDGGTKFQVEMRLHPLLGNSLGYTLTVPTLELPSQQVTQPSFKQRDNTPHEEQPDSPSRRPETDTRTLTNRASVESRIDDMLEILAHADLLHKLVFVSVHTGQLTDMREHVLKTISKLESVDITKSELNVGVNNELGETKDFSTKVESVTESRLLSLLGGKSFNWLEVKIVIKMEVIEILSVNKKIEHVVTLATNLKTGLHPVKSGGLEKLGVLQTSEKVSLDHRLGGLIVESVQHVHLKKFLVRNSNLDGLTVRAMFKIKVLDQGHILSSLHFATSQVVRVWCPIQRDSVRRIVILQIPLSQEWLYLLGQLEVDIFIVTKSEDLILMGNKRSVSFLHDSLRDGVDKRVKVECREVGVVSLDVNVLGLVINTNMDGSRKRVVEMRESNLVLGSDDVSDDNLVDIIEFVPVLVEGVHVSVQRLKFGTTRQSNVERFGSEETLLIKQVECVVVRVVAQQLPTDSVQVGHLRKSELEIFVAGPIDLRGVNKGLGVVEPLQDSLIVFLI